MRGEEWGKIVVDGTSSTSSLMNLFLTASGAIYSFLYSHVSPPFVNCRPRASWPFGAFDLGEGVGGGAGTHGAHRAGACYVLIDDVFLLLSPTFACLSTSKQTALLQTSTCHHIFPLSLAFHLTYLPPPHTNSSSRAPRRSSASLLPKASPRALPPPRPRNWCNISGSITRSICSGGCRWWLRGMTRRYRGREGGKEGLRAGWHMT